MTEEQIENINKLLSSNNADDINLVGSIINNLPNNDKQYVITTLVKPIFKEDTEDVLDSVYSFGLTHRKLDRYLNKIYKKVVSPDYTILTGPKGHEMFEQTLRDQTSLMIKDYKY